MDFGELQEERIFCRLGPSSGLYRNDIWNIESWRTRDEVAS